MNVLIIEDEIPARARLIQILQKIESSITVLAQLGSVKETVAWLKSNPAPDLAFVDIHLSDDHSFRIFEYFNINFPVVFTTAYDKYLLESFEYNSIDYLLKPITEEKLRRTLQKVNTLQQHFVHSHLKELMQKQVGAVVRIVARKGTDFVAVTPDEISYFYTEHKIVFLKDREGRMLIVDRTLSELEEMLREHNFFRINRKYLASAAGIERFKPDSGRIRIYLKPPVNEMVFVSKETAPLFRLWIGKR